jgi:surface antigen
VDEKSYVSSTPTSKELISAFEEVKQEDIAFVKGWAKPRGAVGKGITLQDVETRERLNDALHSTPLGNDVEWEKGGVHFVFTPNSPIYQAYKSGGMCRDGVLVIYDEVSEETTRGIFCRHGVASDWLLLH